MEKDNGGAAEQEAGDDLRLPWKRETGPRLHGTYNTIHDADDLELLECTSSSDERDAQIASLIVRSVNAHHQLVEALEEARDLIKFLDSVCPSNTAGKVMIKIDSALASAINVSPDQAAIPSTGA
jgi:hypothetical protein